MFFNLKMPRIDNIAMVNCYPRDIERLVVLVLYEKKSFNPDDCGDVASGF